MGLFNDRKKTKNGKTQVPVWFMRQAGRYHTHYQNMKKNNDFMSLCKSPKLARDVTMGPIEEFHFDAAILFSDLLFPLEQMNMGLKYAPGPQLDWTLEHTKQLKELIPQTQASDFYGFQGQACQLLKHDLSSEKTLLGFVGAPWTLYTYAAEGGHSGNLTTAKKGFYDGRWRGFCEILIPNLIEEMSIQARGGADGMCLFDTAAGELDYSDYTQQVLPILREVAKEFKSHHPNVPIIYYSKHTHLPYLQAIECANIDVLGIDWRMDLPLALNTLGKDYYIQGNLDPSHLHLPWTVLEEKLQNWWRNMEQVNISLDRWIAGLGHGVLQKTPEENVSQTVEYIHKNFLY